MEGPLAVDDHDNLFTTSEVEARNSLSVDHSVGGWPYVLCRKVFPNDAKMIVNMRHHTDEKPYGCDQCKMRFKLKGTLKRHKSTHSERKP